MTFGEGGWHAGEDTARSIFLRYLEAGGNFIDTADIYAGGRSEDLLGTFIQETGTRDRLVISTKFTVATTPGDPNSGGNGRKNILASLDASLRRLRTDYVDLYWLHMWDAITPAEEVMSTLDTLVRSGKVRAIGLSNVPAWYAAKAHLLAQARGWEPVAALQLEYSLAERSIEREHLPAAAELGIGVIPWSPLANGLLTGKYARQQTAQPQGIGRLAEMETDGTLERTRTSGNPTFTKLFTDNTWRTIDLLSDVAHEIGRSPAQVALNWVTRRPGVVSTLVGATRVQQLDDNLRAIDFEIPHALAERLEEASRPLPGYPYYFFGAATQPMINGGTAAVYATPSWSE
ncbi:aldo/keto reductase [Actinacidiphila oryziradicis]|uniref:Aldo/keto reductase n=2 Tax=Actinacidiphila oryziradicis TaxID=2571141 RepID=A0A4U0SLP1_9ACTN|nr:aldo/keto reductase [Actinacidiphila oryziradicis]